MSEMLQEYVDSARQPLRVDRSSGVIRGVKLLGLRSRNGRRYRDDALREAIELYEGARVNVNHPKGHPLSPRDYQDRLGVVRGVRFRVGDGLFGDLYFNPKHALSEQLVWDAEHAPQNVGLSHNVLARTTRHGEETVVEAIVKVQSIDLVADPATTAGLFEQQESGELRVESREPERPAPALDSGLSALDSAPPTGGPPVATGEVEELRRSYEAQLAELREQLDAMATRERANRQRERIVELLREHDLPLPGADGGGVEPLVGQQFIETLMRTDDEQALRRLVEERAALIRSAGNWDQHRRTSARPRSRDQAVLALANGAGRTQSAAEFAAAIRGR